MIKYRVYDKLEKQMRRVVSLHWQNDTLVAVKVEGEAEPLPIEGRFIVEQYTGLKDKNGMEIAVGDIVKHRGYYGRAKNSAVEFNKGCFNTGEHDGSSTRKRPMLLQNNCEVIGNIHENADLLKGQHEL